MLSTLDFLGALRTRGASFRILQSEFKLHDLPSATGWDKLTEQYTGQAAHEPEQIRRATELADIYLRQLLFNSKAVFIFQVPTELLLGLAEQLRAVDVSGSPYVTCFPLTLGSEQLKEQPYSPSYPTQVIEDGDCLRVVMCVKRAFKAREEIDVREFMADDRERLSGYDEVIGIRAGIRQAFDSIVLNTSSGRLEIYVDLCCPMKAEEINNAGNWYRDWVKARAREADIERDLQFVPLNFFPLIAALYEQADGRVVSLGHSTGTRSLKDEKMRGRNLDLRDELFHKEGLRAIGRTDAFSICKQWEKSIGSGVLSITIPGHFSMAGQLTSWVNYAELEGATTGDEIAFLLAKLT